ncbi:neuromedin U [Myxococcus sp. K38C18041901]|uniref:neuromedin U n=1 Tax=Myxococcus guangdongensis TaxID=2906760 RepID=UPI0020A7C8EB|nr:neuromedin U [Myxococcus guangdongensis]MCP3061828.1 neuromedin U [Myxococcus guangdongensis]
MLMLVPGLVFAADPKPPAEQGQDHQQDLAKAVQNPVAALISVPLQDNVDLGVEPGDRVRNTLNIQPVVPLPLTRDFNVITRVILPILYQPDLGDGEGGTFGLGDTSATFFLSPKKPGAVIWGVGPAFLLPTATNEVLGTGKWSVGPSAVALIQPEPWSIGVLANNVFSVFGGDDRATVNQLLLQYFISYNLPKGWYLTSSPLLTANWEAPSGEKWTVPFGLGAGKVFTVGKQALNGSVAAYYNAIRPDLPGAAQWQLRVQLSFLFPLKKKAP